MVIAAELRQQYHRRLEDIEDVLLESAYRVAEFMPRVTQALAIGDASIQPLVGALREDVTISCQEVEERCFRLLALQTPVAGELRALVAMLRLVTHVDRACALLSHVAGTTRSMSMGRLPAEMAEIVRDLASRSLDVFRAGLDAWRTRNPEAVPAVVALDEGVDTLQVELLERARALSLPNDALVSLGLLARYYERIADHGVAFARDIAFVVRAERPATRT